MLYLACPYSHPDEAVRRQRYHLACRTAAKLMKAGIVVFSPLANSVPAVEFGGLELSHAEFMAIDLPILQRCDEILVLALEDWQDSLGVRQELGTALALQKPVTMITEEEIEHLPAITHAAKCFLVSSIFTEVLDAT
jgi:nucleoside 2-deoxyribosyltransferase